MSEGLRFTLDTAARRVVFGAGVLQELGAAVDRLGLSQVALVCSPRLASQAEQLLGPRRAVTLSHAVMQVPIEAAARAVERVRAAAVEGLVAVGGGSPIGLAKAVALQTGLPIVAVPTTYAGSEMTSVWGLTEAGQKRTGRDDRVRPRVVLYDPDLMRALPAPLAAASGLNAMAHAVEALYAREVDSATTALAEKGIREIGRGLPARASAGVCYGAWLSGMCLDGAQMGIHHKLCHVLGGTFGLPHAAAHAVVLPYATAFNRDAAPAAMQHIARALGAARAGLAPEAIWSLARRVGAPSSLAEIGMREADLDRAAELAAVNPYAYIRPVDPASLRSLLGAAFAGGEPRSVG